MGVESIRLEDSPAETWANTILYRLAIALGVAKAGDGTIQVDPDGRRVTTNHANRSQGENR